MNNVNTNWLDDFAASYSKVSKRLSKTANKKIANQVILSRDVFPSAVNGEQVVYKGAQYIVRKADFVDEKGEGILIEEIVDVPSTDDFTEVIKTKPDESDVTESAEYAVQPDQGDVYHLPVQEVEVEKFEDEAAQTELEIAEENIVDGSTPEGRIQRMLDTMEEGNTDFYFPDPIDSETEVEVSVEVEPEPEVESEPEPEPEVEVESDIQPEVETADELEVESEDDEEIAIESSNSKLNANKITTNNKEVKNMKKELSIINLKAKKVASTILSEVTDTCDDAEFFVKKHVPAKKVRATLSKIESKLAQNGISVKLNKSAISTALTRKADEEEEVTEVELDEVVDAVVEAVLAEVEEVLEQQDEIMDAIVEELAGTIENADLAEIEEALKVGAVKQVSASGVTCRFNKKHAKTKNSDLRKKAGSSKVKANPSKKKTLLDRIKSSF